MTRVLLVATLALLSIVASVSALPAEPQSRGSRNLGYVLGGAELGHKCPPADSNLGGACASIPDTNVFDMDIRVVDNSGLPVRAYFEYSVAGLVIDHGMFCGAVHVHTNYANAPSILVLPSLTGLTAPCDGVRAAATAGSIELSW